MPHPFKVEKEIELEATPEQVWEAIATGQGLDGWFLGSGNEVEPRKGGRVRVSFGEEVGESMVTTWEPNRRLAYRSEPAPDGSLHAFEYVIEGRGGRTIVRLVHSGFLGDDWEKEYEALGEGDFMYLHLMAQYVTHFRGRPATNVSIWRSDSTGREAAMAGFREAMGLSGEPRAEGTRVRFTVPGLDPVDGVIDFVSRSIIGVRTDDALYRFLYSPQGVVFLGHHIYRDDIDPQETKRSWETWLERAFASAAV